MFLLDGKPLSPDVAFTDINGIQRPANWLRLASAEERAAAGITEVPDPPSYDQRFYWGPDLPKDHAELVSQWSEQTRTTANTLLQPSDWMVIREADNGAEVPLEVKAYRQLVREKCGTKITAIEATTTTAELAAYITSPDYSTWFDAAPAADDSAADGLEFAIDGGSTGSMIAS
jgi:hypothetical protein